MDLKQSSNQNSPSLKMSLQEIKEDIINEDRSSSIYNSNFKPIHSHTNSEGVDQIDLI